VIVVDTTVLAALMIEPTIPEPVEELRHRDSKWAAPDLWRHELISVAWKYIRIDQLTVAAASDILVETELIMHPRTFRVSPALVLSTALEFGISAYDAHFAALAREMNTTLYTHDRALIDCCPDIARHPESVA
jgi:predicted nucleic acid-binding protein